MNSICRLCLCVCPKNMHKSCEELEVFAKIRTCLPVDIPYHELLPNQVCLVCEEKVENIHRFNKLVTKNQEILQKHLKNGKMELENFYFSLTNDFIKNEVKKTLENKENGDFNIYSNLSQSITDFNNSKEENIVIKEEEIGHNELNEYSSEDELTLSTIKTAKENKYSDQIKTKPKNLESQSKKSDYNNDPDTLKPERKIFNIALTHKCLTCFEIFDSQTKLLHHYNIEHGHKNVTNDSENGGSGRFTSVTSENGNLSFKCEKCERIYDNKKAINKHIVSHIEIRPFICKMCGRTYKTASEIIRHGRAHSGVKMDCSYQCGYSTVYMGALKDHERRHRTEFKYKCDECGKGFQVKTWYLEHQNIHNGVKPFVCNICGLAFHMNRYLTTHRSTVHPQSSAVKRYICVHCSLPCDSRNALTEHLKEHGIRSSFLCDICGKTLSSLEQLKFHKRMHLGVKPYACSTCNKSFAKKFNLTVHERTHTGERAHACTKCGKRYAQRSTLQRHNMRHHSGSPRKCPKCLKSFTSRNQFENHERLCIPDM